MRSFIQALIIFVCTSWNILPDKTPHPPQPGASQTLDKKLDKKPDKKKSASGVLWEAKKWEGQTNEKGSVSIAFRIPSEKIFSLQGYIFYKKAWRPINVFWNEDQIWFDLGAPFKGIPYKVFLIPGN